MKKAVVSLALMLAVFSGSAQNSILWEITGNGLNQPSYLMGTLKFIGEREFYLPKEAVSMMSNCKIFAIEDQVDHHAQLELNKAVHFPAGKSLATELSPADYSQVTAFFQKEFGISPKKFEKKLARLIPLALSMSMTRMSLGEDVKYYDMELLLIAKNNKLETYSLEPIERESQAIAAFPMKDQEAALLHSISHFEEQKSDYRKLEVAYLRGDLDKVFEYSLHPTENNPVFVEEFYYKRNQEWIPKLTKMMHDKPSFIAVGVSHLEGDQGILNLLKQGGYTLRPITVTH